MRADAKTSTGRMLILMLLGIVALYADPRWLTILIPAALLVWFTNAPVFGSSRGR